MEVLDGAHTLARASPLIWSTPSIIWNAVTCQSDHALMYRFESPSASREDEQLATAGAEMPVLTPGTRRIERQRIVL